MPNKSFSELTPEEVLMLAIDVEQGSATRLRTFAELFNDYAPEVAGFLAQMAHEEHEHSRQLETGYQQRYGELRRTVTEADVPEIFQPFDIDDAEHMVFDDLSLRRALEALLAIKRQALGFYGQALEKANENELQTLFQEMVAFEADHVQWIEARLDSLGGST